jgi:hypothetical protein
MTKKMFPTEKQANREIAFWNKTTPIPDTGCLIWTGAQRPNGYGKVNYKKKYWIAHRLAWLFTFGSLADDICVLHRCDTPLCVNPRHLFLGTKIDNSRDMDLKGRRRVGHISGELHGRSKLKQWQVNEIRESSLQRKILADRFGVCRQMIDNIKTFKNWRS